MALKLNVILTKKSSISVEVVVEDCNKIICSIFCHDQGCLAIYMPPLYLPRKFLQLGDLCVTEFNESMQQGMQAQGHNL